MKYNIENESLIISYYINNFDKVDVFHTSLFQDENINKISKALETMKAENLHFSLDSLSVELNKLDSKVKFQELITLKESYVDFQNIEYHIQQLRSDYNKQVVSKGLMQSIISKVNSAGEVESKSLLESLDNIKKSIIDTDEKLFYNSEELVERYIDTLNYRLNPDKNKSMGFRCIDECVTRPGAAGEISILASLRGSGKSAMKKVMQNNLINKGIPVVEFSIEMSEESGMDRDIAMKTGINMMDLNKNPKAVLEDPRFIRISDQYRKFKNYLFTDKADMSLDQLDIALYKAKEIFRNNGVFKEGDEYMFVTIDVLNMITDFGDQTPTSILIAMDKLHRIVKKHMIHVMGVAQINESKLRGGKIYSDPEQLNKYRPNLEDIYGGSAYAQRARLVGILHRPRFLKERMFPDMSEIWEAEPDILQYHCVKQNDGELFFKEFIFDGEKMRIVPYIRVNEEDV